MPNSIRPTIGVIVACHNEESYLSQSLESIFQSLAQVNSEARVLVILDRCSDRSQEISASFPVESLKKENTTWRNSYAENLEMGFEKFRGQDYISVVDADVAVPEDFFKRLTQELENGTSLGSVASELITDSSTTFNKIYRCYELVFKRVALGESSRGACRVYRGKKIEDFYRTNGPPIIGDYIAPDSRLDQRLQAQSKVLHDVRSLHLRRINLAKCIQGQKNAGRARRELHSSFFKTLLHSIFRLRPFVIAGYLSYQEST